MSARRGVEQQPGESAERAGECAGRGEGPRPGPGHRGHSRGRRGRDRGPGEDGDHLQPGRVLETAGAGDIRHQSMSQKQIWVH